MPGLAAHTNSDLVNAWGIAFGPGGPWWVNSAQKSPSLVFDGTGAPFPAATPLKVTIPPAGASEPTGIVFNGTADFLLDTMPDRRALFLFASTTGTISGWNPGVDPNAVIKITKAGEDARTLIAQWEKQGHVTPSQPQISIGSGVSKWLAPLEARMPKTATPMVGRPAISILNDLEK